MTPSLGINAATWLRLNPLLDAALDLPARERVGWLAALPAQDADLQTLLQQLLANSGRIEQAALLEALPELDGRDATATSIVPHAAGTLIGPYRLLRELGVGGMGVVWLAERADGLMAQRQVALKLPHNPHFSLDTDLAARMAREREILATLDHPHIARLYDAGIAPGGQPFLALEYVDGQRIDLYCQAQQLGLRQRLMLFQQAARAVAHAHSQLVVHRDIKPSNLLVDSAVQVKLLDFGISRLLDDGRLPALALTQQGQRALTPEYAAPEQIAGLPVGTRSDVYALGVLLFELLTGSRPYRLKRDSRAALEDAILAADVPRPSSMVADARLRRALRGDIDTIVLKALKKNASERYASVDAMNDDIERYLHDRPVLAQPDSVGYRARKFVLRNRVAVVTAAALLLTLLGGAGAALWQARIAISERQRAEDVKEFVATIFREASPYNGSGTQQLTAVDLLKQADKKLQAKLSGQTAVRIELSNMIGESLVALGDVQAAEPVIARAVAEAGPALGASHLQTLRAMLLQSQVHRLRGRPQPARDDIDRILPTLREHSASRPAEFASALVHRTMTAIDLGEYADAERFALEAVQFTSQHFAKTETLRVTSAVLLPLAYRFNKKFELARQSAEHAVQLTVAAHGDTPPHPRVIEARSVYGRALADTGELARGIGLLESATADARTMLGPKAVLAAVFMQNMVDYRLELGDLAAALANATDAMVVIGENFAPDSMSYAVALHSRAMAQMALHKGSTARANQQDGAALIDANRAAAALHKLLSPGHEVAVAARTTAALALAHVGQLDAALLTAEQVAPHANKLPPSNVQRARASRVHGTVLRLKGDAAAALPILQAVADSTDPAPKWQRERMRAWAQLGWAQLAQGAAVPAVQSFERALKEFERLEAHPTPARADALLGLERARAQVAHGR